MKINLDFLNRKKNVDSIQMEESKLARVLNTFDLTMLGIGCTFGSGIYVLVGNVIANYAGPSVIFSFVIAGIATFLSGMSYAELGARVPRSGSAYVYIYVTIGEFIAFVIGWDLILEYMIGSAGTANALSQYINSLCDNKIKNSLQAAMPIHLKGLGPYPDFLAFGIILVVVAILIVGVKESALMNRVFVCLNTIVILFIIVTGATKADQRNWNLGTEDFHTNWTYAANSHSACQNAHGCGSGGFLPYGFYGMIQGAAKCFYAYIGFDSISTTGEEVKNPLKALPMSILITLVVCTIAYLGVSVVVTLMIPYFLIDTNAPLPSAFAYVHYDWARYVVSMGAIVSLATCLYASMFPMPRVVYSIASDGLIFKFLSKVLPKVKTPALATLITGILTAILAAIFDLDQLVEMTSIGTLLAYTLVSSCVVILRYRPGPPPAMSGVTPAETPTKDEYIPIFGTAGEEKLWQKLFVPVSTEATHSTSKIVNIFTITSVIDIVIICLIFTFANDLKAAYIIVFLVIFFAILVACVFIVWRQPQNKNIHTFKIPFVPFFPMISIFINTYLMMSLSLYTWIRFFIWFAIGFSVYFLYGIRNSLENKRPFSWFPCIEINNPSAYEPSADAFKLEENSTATTTNITPPKTPVEADEPSQ